MVVRSPLVFISGVFNTLPPGDSVYGVDLTAQASGNAGISTGLTALASGNAGISTGVTALASGNAGISTGLTALASGNAGISTGLTALASGNAGLSIATAALPKAGGTLTGDVTLNAQSDLRLADADSSNWVALQAPAIVTANVTWTLPSGDGTASQALTTDGAGTLAWATAGGAFAAGTVMLFVQAAAPTGWTKSTTHNDKALRIVSGSGGGTGGTTAFTTVFASRTPAGTVGNTTLSESQIPSHSHSISAYDAGEGGPYTRSASVNIPWTVNTNSTGGGGSHTHGFTGTALDFAVNYVDAIIATKN